MTDRPKQTYKPLCPDAWCIPPSKIMLEHGNDYHTCSKCGEPVEVVDLKPGTDIGVGTAPQQQPAGEGELRELTIRELLNITIREAMEVGMPATNIIENTEEVFNNLIANRLSAMLEKILANGSGGGNWRRLLVEEIDRLKGKDAG